MEKIIINKNGVFFTLISIVVIMVMLVMLKPSTQEEYASEFDSVYIGIRTYNDFVTDIDNVYIPTILRSSSTKALTAITYYMDDQDFFVEDLIPIFNEVIVNGTIGEVLIDSYYAPIKIMENHTLFNWSTKLSDIATESFNVIFDIDFHNVYINQSNPWQININLEYSYMLDANIAMWTNNHTWLTTTLDLVHLIDPWYYVHTDGAYVKNVKIARTKYGHWNNTEFRAFLNNETYFHWEESNSSSYLMRFTNRFEDSQCCGIESVVDPNHASIGDKRQSYIDYYYFNDTYLNNCTNLYNLTPIWDEFDHVKLDFDSLIRYNISGGERTCS